MIVGERMLGRVERVDLPSWGYYPNATLKLFMTEGCNLDCSGCFNNSSIKKLEGHSAVKELSFEEMSTAMMESKKSFGTYMVEFSGGEPLIRFHDLCGLLKIGGGLNFRTRIVTNASIIGASGDYRKYLDKFIPDLNGITGEEMVSALTNSGLQNVLISIDSMHTDSDINHGVFRGRAPFKSVVDAIKLFLKFGYGHVRDENEHNELDMFGLRIGVTTAGNDYPVSFGIVQDVLRTVDEKVEFVSKEGGRRIWRFSDGQVVAVHRNSTADVGRGKNLKDAQFKSPGEKIFSRQCYHFKPREKGVDGYLNQEMAINYDGCIYSCGTQSFCLGNVRANSLSQVVQYVNSEETIPNDFKNGVEAFREMLKIAQETGGINTNGEAFRRIVEIRPELMQKVLAIRSHTGGCHALGHDPDYLSALKEYRKRYIELNNV